MNRENLVIYNKGANIIDGAISRENVGREADTFFHYIIGHYHELPDYLILLQGHPFDHMNNIGPDNFQIEIDSLIGQRPARCEPLFKGWYHENHYTCPSIKTKEYYAFFFEGDVPPIEIVFAAGCQYIIPKECILCRPIEFYMKIHSMILKNPILTIEQAVNGTDPFYEDSIDGWCLERLFSYCFNPEIHITDRMRL